MIALNDNVFDTEEYITRIRLLRKLYKMAPKEFAEFVGIDNKTWSHYEHGYPISRKSFQFLHRKIFGFPVEWLWYGDETHVESELLKKLHLAATLKN